MPLFYSPIIVFQFLSFTLAGASFLRFDYRERRASGDRTRVIRGHWRISIRKVEEE
jgi:hypothetical protein